MDIQSPDNLSLLSFTDGHDLAITRYLSDILSEIRDHLTKEELLCVALFKNSKKPQHNHIFRVFLEKHHGKKLTSSAITHRKHRLLKVLRYVGALLRFKRDNNLDSILKSKLTKKQYKVLLQYEKRELITNIGVQLNMGADCVSRAFCRAIIRLENCQYPLIRRYLELLNNVLRYSRKGRLK
jgi:hypothetical protein